MQRGSTKAPMKERIPMGLCQSRPSSRTVKILTRLQAASNETRRLKNLSVYPMAKPATVRNVQSDVHILERHKLETSLDQVIQLCPEHWSFPSDQ